MKQTELKNVLVADDEPYIVEIWEEVIGDMGHAVYTASNGNEGVRIIESHPIDLVLTDIRMPVADGFVILDHIKNNELTMSVIVCSGFTEFEQQLDNYDLFKVINKPFKLKEEMQIIQDLLAN